MKKFIAIVMAFCIVGGSFTTFYSSAPECAVAAEIHEHGTAFLKHDNKEVPYDNSFYKDAKKGFDPDDSSIHPRLTIDKLEVPMNYAGKTQRISLTISGADHKYCSTALHIVHDDRITVKDENSLGFGDATSSRLMHEKRNISDSEVWFSTAGLDDYCRDGVYAYIDFTIPENAKIGDLYPIGIEYFSSEKTEDCFTNSKIDQCMEAWFFTYGIENGYIKMVDYERPYDLTYGDFEYCIYDDHAELLSCNKEASGDIIIPTEIEGVPVTSINENAFYECYNIRSVKIPDTVTSIGNSAFFKCKILESVDMGNSITSIGANAFQHCRYLEDIILPDTISNIGYNAFYDTKWLSDRSNENDLVAVNGILIKSNYGYGADVVIPDTISVIIDKVFSGSSINSVVLPDSLKSIGSYAFADTRISTVSIPENVSVIEEGVFSGCNYLENVILPDSLKEIKSKAFYYNALTNVEIPDSVSSIGEKAFSNCYKLKKVTIYNPECEIYDSNLTFCTGYDDVYSEYYFNGTICGYDNSTAQAYAKKYGYKFESLGEAPTSVTEFAKGDANGDNSIDMADVVIVMQAYLNPKKYGVNGTSPDRITSDGEKAGDVDGNKGLSANDALLIQKFALKLIDKL